MSPLGAAVLGVSGVIILGVLALWLLNAPLWSLPVYAGAALLGFRRYLRRRAASPASRENTES